MHCPDENQIRDTLRSVRDEQSGMDIVEAGMVSAVSISTSGEVVFLLNVDPARGAALEPLRQAAENAVRGMKGVSKVSAILTAERPAGTNISSSSPEFDPHGINKIPPLNLPIRHIVAVASGKGGVGKSTVAANLAVQLGVMGYKVGLLDADIYGPSQPRMMGLRNQKPDSAPDNRIIPLTAHGIKIMSIGFMVAEERAMIWRGPMVQSAIVQLLRDVVWGTSEKPLDILIVDMPPGTGDAQLTMAQKIKLSGAVIVSTPQDIALLDARKGLEMFRKTDVPILGVVENMSHYICPSCGHEDHIFGHGGAQTEAKKLDCPFLGAIPLNRDIRLRSDEGMPIVLSAPQSEAGKSYIQIAAEMLSQLKI